MFSIPCARVYKPRCTCLCLMYVFTPPRVCLYKIAFVHIISTKKVCLQHVHVHLYGHVRASLHVYTSLYTSLQPACVQLYNRRARIYNAACTYLQLSVYVISVRYYNSHVRLVGRDAQSVPAVRSERRPDHPGAGPRHYHARPRPVPHRGRAQGHHRRDRRRR